MATYQHPKHAAKKEYDETHDHYSKTRLWAAFFIGLILFFACAIPAHSHSLTGLQASIFRSINNISLPSAFTTAAKYATEALGAGWAIAGCVIIALAYKKFGLAWKFLFTAGGTVVAFYIIKKIINEPRPIAMLHGNLHQRVVETGPGFPSGHMATATALALTLWFVLPKTWRWLLVIWILVVAFSRLYLGVHTPVDIIGGFAVGLMAVSFVRLLPDAVSKPIRLENQ